MGVAIRVRKMAIAEESVECKGLATEVHSAGAVTPLMISLTLLRSSSISSFADILPPPRAPRVSYFSLAAAEAGFRLGTRGLVRLRGRRARADPFA